MDTQGIDWWEFSPKAKQDTSITLSKDQVSLRKKRRKDSKSWETGRRAVNYWLLGMTQPMQSLPYYSYGFWNSSTHHWAYQQSIMDAGGPYKVLLLPDKLLGTGGLWRRDSHGFSCVPTTVATRIKWIAQNLLLHAWAMLVRKMKTKKTPTPSPVNLWKEFVWFGQC